MLQVTDKALAE